MKLILLIIELSESLLFIYLPLSSLSESYHQTLSSFSPTAFGEFDQPRIGAIHSQENQWLTDFQQFWVLWSFIWDTNTGWARHCPHFSSAWKRCRFGDQLY